VSTGLATDRANTHTELMRGGKSEWKMNLSLIQNERRSAEMKREAIGESRWAERHCHGLRAVVDQFSCCLSRSQSICYGWTRSMDSSGRYGHTRAHEARRPTVAHSRH